LLDTLRSRSPFFILHSAFCFLLSAFFIHTSRFAPGNSLSGGVGCFARQRSFSEKQPPMNADERR